MPDDTDRGAWRVTTDHERIEALAHEYDRDPVLVEESEGDLRPRLVPDDDRASERSSWTAFFERLDADDLAVRYRQAEPIGSDRDVLQVIDRETASRTAAEATTRDPADLEADQFAQSDTGDREPVTFDATESRTDDGHEPAESESAAGAETGALVLDEVYEAPGERDPDPNEEYLVFQNAADEPLDLSGWTVANEAGRTYAFPDGTVIDPGGRLTLYSGVGTDTATERHWGSDESVWDVTGDTVTVTTPDGRRIIRERYKG